jgi:DNA helicase HerA-like ATPase
MTKNHWDDPPSPAKWEQAADTNRYERKRLHARDMPSDGIMLGTNLAAQLPIYVTPRQLSTHMHVVGGTGVGKSYFLEGITKYRTKV